MVNFEKIEKKWQKAWSDAKINEAERDDSKEKFMFIFAYPGISGYMHVGHMRGYSFSDLITRYKRMQGFNVLFPVGAHPTGNQAISFAMKLKNKDKNWLEYLRNNSTPESKIKAMETPENIVDFFSDVYIDAWKNFGFLADWRRFTHTIKPDYNKFIQWQFKKLKQRNLLYTGEYYAPACPTHGPVAVDPSETDLSSGGNAEKMEYTLLKFEFEDGYKLVAATLRPETVYGQTNLWVNPDVDYVRIKIDKEFWIVSKTCAAKLAFQGRKVIIGEKISGKDIIGKMATAPAVDRKIPILPAKFVAADIGTGIVTSVPSDAPYDYIALKELQDNPSGLSEFGIDADAVKAIKLIPIIKTDGYGDFPGKEVVEKFGIKTQDDPKLEEATKEIYAAGFHKGYMATASGPYKGLSVIEAKDKIGKDLKAKGQADVFHDLSEEVVCRCSERVFIKRIDDQWFIRYSDEQLTIDSADHSRTMTIRPSSYERDIPNAIGSFPDRACTRIGNWLGTTFPFDDKWIIEAISDSTLYPLYYLVSLYVNQGKLKPENLTEHFFDYVFLGEGDIKHVVDETRLPKDLIDQIRKDVEYWYPLDINLGGKEHRTVHFPPFVMNHVAILPKRMWPKGVLVNWWVIGKGGKISKSKGGAQPIPDAVKSFSVDGMRMYYSHVASMGNDVAWDEDVAMDYRKSLEKVFNLISDFESTNVCVPQTYFSKALISRFYKKVQEAQDALDDYDSRKYVQSAFFDVMNLVNDYLRFAPEAEVKCTLYEVFNDWVKIIAPVIPHTAEELWHKLGNDSLVSAEAWPKVQTDLIDDESEFLFDLVSNVVSDVRKVQQLAKLDKLSKVSLFVSDDWKFDLFKQLRSVMQDTMNPGEIMKSVMKSDAVKKQGKVAAKIVQSVVKDPSKVPAVVLSSGDEFAALDKSRDFFLKTFGCEVSIVKASETKEKKASSALPGKPAILVE